MLTIKYKIFFTIVILLFVGRLQAQPGVFRTSSWLLDPYQLAAPLAERSEWFIPDKFVQLHAFTGQYDPGSKIRTIQVTGNYSTKPDWGYTYRPVHSWSGWGGSLEKTWQNDFKENSFSPSYYWTYRTKMKTFQRPEKKPIKLSFFLVPRITQYKARKSGANLEKKYKFNARTGFVMYKDKYFAGIQVAQMFTTTVNYELDGESKQVIYPSHYNAFFSYNYKWFRPTVIGHYYNQQWSFEAAVEKEILLKKKLTHLPWDVHAFAVGDYSYLNNSIAAAIGVKHIFTRLDAFFKFQKQFKTELGKVKPLFELSVLWRFGPPEMDRVDQMWDRNEDYENGFRNK